MIKKKIKLNLKKSITYSVALILIIFLFVLGFIEFQKNQPLIVLSCDGDFYEIPKLGEPRTSKKHSDIIFYISKNINGKPEFIYTPIANQINPKTLEVMPMWHYHSEINDESYAFILNPYSDDPIFLNINRKNLSAIEYFFHKYPTEWVLDENIQVKFECRKVKKNIYEKELKKAIAETKKKLDELQF